MRLFAGKRRGLLYFAPFLLIGGFYFVTQLFPLTYHAVHLPLDDAIPFLPVFVVPYLLWYPYVPLPMVFAFFKDQRLLRRQALALFPAWPRACFSSSFTRRESIFVPPRRARAFSARSAASFTGWTGL